MRTQKVHGFLRRSIRFLKLLLRQVVGKSVPLQIILVFLQAFLVCLFLLCPLGLMLLS